MHMEHTIAKDAFSGLSGNNAVYNAICIAVCDDEQFMCDMIEEKIKEMLPDAVVCKFFSAQELLDSETQIDILFLDIQMPEWKRQGFFVEIGNRHSSYLLQRLRNMSFRRLM